MGGGVFALEPMAYSYVDYTGNGATTDYTVTFDYLDEDDVSADVDGAAPAFTWLNATTIRFDEAPANGSAIRISRESSRETRVVDWSGGSTLTEEDLDNDSKHAFFLAQEAFDAVTGESVAVGTIGASELAAGAVTTAKIADDAVTVDKLANNAVGSDQIVASAVTTAKINDSAVTTAKINDGAVTAVKTTGLIPTSTVTTKGDIIAATGNAAVTRVAVGADGTLLQADSAQASGVKWATGVNASGVAKAWVVFNGTGTPAIGASFNVTSITDNGVGDYTVNFTTPFSSANYVVSGTCQTDTGGVNGTGNSFISIRRAAGMVAAGSCRILTISAEGNNQDCPYVSLVFFGEQ